MARIGETEHDLNGVVHSVKLKLGDASIDSQKVLQRPISKIVLLVEDELVQFSDEGSHRSDFKKIYLKGSQIKCMW